jgi:hypothetical protein
VILAIELDYPLPFTIPIDLLFWHVEAGVAMTLISLFHMGWHFTYYKNVVRNARAKVRALRAAEREFEIDDRRLVLEAREARGAERDARRAQREMRRAERKTPWVQHPAGAGDQTGNRAEQWTSPRPLIDLELE